MLSWHGIRPIALIFVFAAVAAEAVGPADPLRLAELCILGGSAEDASTGIAVGPGGEILVAGRTQSPDFPVAEALLKTCTQSGGRCGDGFLSKLKGTAGPFYFSTFIGRFALQRATAVTSDAAGNIFFAAYYTGRRDGSGGGFLVKLDPNGKIGYATELAWKVPVQGVSWAVPVAIAVDGAGRVQVACWTIKQATSGLTVPNRDIVVAQFDPAGKPLHAIVFGWDGDDEPRSMAIASDGTTWLGGTTTSSQFPKINAAELQGSSASKRTERLEGDGFVARLDVTSNKLLYSAAVGSRFEDSVTAVALDREGNVYLAGETRSRDLPMVGAAQPRSGGGSDDFMMKLSPDGQKILFSTFLGGAGDEGGAKLTVDPGGTVWVAGVTASPGFPGAGTAGAPCDDPRCNDVFVVGLSASGAIGWATRFGGKDEETVGGIAPGPQGSVYVTGMTASSDLPAPTGVLGIPKLPDAYLARFTR